MLIPASYISPSQVHVVELMVSDCDACRLRHVFGFRIELSNTVGIVLCLMRKARRDVDADAFSNQTVHEREPRFQAEASKGRQKLNTIFLRFGNNPFAELPVAHFRYSEICRAVIVIVVQ